MQKKLPRNFRFETASFSILQEVLGWRVTVYRETDTGRLYGITFIDHNTGVVLNGSRIGKEYSANAIIDRLENPQRYEHLTNTPQAQTSTSFTHQQQVQQRQEVQPVNHQSATSNLISGSLGLFDLPTTGSDDPEEEMFRRRMQQQHKKKKGRRL